MAVTDPLRSSYDRFPYPARPFPQTHPDRLATIGMLFALNVQPIDRCRVIEIGCARGGNLVPMAAQLPESNFLGIDFSSIQIDDARRLSKDLGLKNIEFRCLDIRDAGAGLGQFDYIICHGVFSWVSQAVQDKILELCSSCLLPQGVAYVSYNTYPAWHVRGMVRDMMYYHANQFGDPQTRIRQAREMLDLLIESNPETTPYGALLRTESRALRDKEDGYFLHDQLELFNAPVYFAQFAERARVHGLQYLAEADLPSMWSRQLPPGIAASVERLTDDLIQREQYLDFVRNREFRQTLLCHQGMKIRRELRPDGLDQFYVAAPLAGEKGPIDVCDSRPARFQHLPTAQVITATAPLVKGAMLALAEAWPASVAFCQLLSDARARTGLASPADPANQYQATCLLGKSMLEAHLSGYAELHCAPARFSTQAGLHPLASPLARIQAATSNRLTNLRHEACMVSDLAQRILPYLDGSRDRAELQGVFRRMVEGGSVNLSTGCTTTLDHLLETLARSAFLL
jgi:methyltransferase-like protein/SAM-dependent methyltransferase